MVECLTPLLLISEVRGSNLSPETGYPDRGILWFSWVPPGPIKIFRAYFCHKNSALDILVKKSRTDLILQWMILNSVVDCRLTQNRLVNCVCTNIHSSSYLKRCSYLRLWNTNNCVLREKFGFPPNCNITSLCFLTHYKVKVYRRNSEEQFVAAATVRI
jgi:hypothetical protein